jgi:hypothetical protein
LSASINYFNAVEQSEFGRNPMQAKTKPPPQLRVTAVKQKLIGAFSIY